MNTAAANIHFSSLTDKLGQYLDRDQVRLVCKAYQLAHEAHDGQARKSGEPYISHPVAVAHILAEMHMDHQCLIAALLHDVIEDTGIPKQMISLEFDETVANLVDGVSKLNRSFYTQAEAQAENFQKMTLAMSRDIRVIMVKLADRLHNMRTLTPLDMEKRKRIARETMEIYAPIANRLGMYQMRVEFEELGFRILHPLRSNMIEKAVRKSRGNRKEVISQIQTSIEQALSVEDIVANVSGREKHLYSIYDKMRTQHKSFAEITDVYGFRIVVDNADTCYRVLGAVHNLYKPLAGRFKDYIAIPKANGYQSLHTTLFGMHGIPIEIQIRTVEMDKMANNGIAAHWLYKSTDDNISGSHQRAREWMSDLLEMQQSAGDSLEFIENVKIDLFPDEVYLFSPKGQIYELAQGATPIDFAYAVHTDIGNTCVACRIDRHLAPLSATLESGQTIEIITAPGAQPNPDWLSFVVTGKARSSIRHALKHQQTSESIALGERLLDRALKSFDMSLADVADERIDLVMGEHNADTLDALLEDIGLGNQMANIIASKLQSTNDEGTVTSAGQPLTILGTEGLVVQYGGCCKPIPGDPIVGHISAGRGIVIHNETCHNIRDLRDKPEELVAVRWDPDVDQEFSVELRVEVEHHRSIVALLATVITNADASVERINTVDKDARLSVVNIVLAVRNRVHLAHVIRRLRTVKGVGRISRYRTGI